MKKNIWIFESRSDFIRELYSVIQRNQKCFYIIDAEVYNLHSETIKELLTYELSHKLILQLNEESKNFHSVTRIYDFLFNNNANREDLLVVIGGGILGDIGGFVASSYMRGIKYVNIPTTLISQTDSSIGGKVGYNYSNVKNAIGSFYDPEAILIYTDFLNTLPKKELISGFGEIIKYALIDSEDLLVYVEHHIDELTSLQPGVISYIINKCVEIKKNIVEKDFKDMGLRNTLNFGHTVGHAIEIDSQYELSHGEAVALGILVALKLSEKKLGLDEKVFLRIENLYRKLDLKLNYCIKDYRNFLKTIKSDKKNDDNMRFVLLGTFGDMTIRVVVTEDELLWAIKESIEGDN